MLKRCLEIVNLGSPSIKLVLEQSDYHPGEKIEGHFQLEGGWVDQDLSRLDCDLVMKDEGTNKIKNICNVMSIFMAKQLKSKQLVNKPFSYRLPADMEAGKNVTYELRTKLVFGNEKAAKDEVRVNILA